MPMLGKGSYVTQPDACDPFNQSTAVRCHCCSVCRPTARRRRAKSLGTILSAFR